MNSFARHNTIFWFASLGVAALNYLYYPIIGRLLPAASFGEVQTIISFLTQLSIFLQVLGVVSIGVIARYKDEAERQRVLAELSRVTLLLGGLIVLAMVVCSPLLKGFFRFGSIVPFLLLAASLLVSMAMSLANAYLQGHKRFGKLAVANVTNASLKIVFAVLFVTLGARTLGAIGGLIAAQLVALAYALFVGQGIKRFITDTVRFTPIDKKIIRPELPYAVVVLVSALAANLLLSLDILVVKHYFRPELAGLYGGISVIANAIFYVSGPFAAVLLPSLAPTAPKAKNLKLLRRSLGLTVAVGGGAMLMFLALPQLIVTILLGHNYVPYAGYLRGLAVALFIMSLANMLIYYHLGIRHYLVAPVSALGVALTLVIIGLRHATLGAIVGDLIAGSCVVLILLIGLTLRYHRRDEYA